MSETKSKFFTDVPLPGSQFNKDTEWGRSWMVHHDWEILPHERDNRLSEKDYQILLTAIRCNLPVVIGIKDVGDSVRTVVANVEYMTCNDGDDRIKSANLIRVHYWGFGHNLWFPEIVSISTPDVLWS